MSKETTRKQLTWKQFKQCTKDWGVTDTAIVFGKLKFENKNGMKYTLEMPKPKKVKAIKQSKKVKK